MGVQHPVTAGWIAGTMEIMVTFPLEYTKTQLQLQQEASSLYAGADKYRSAWHCASSTLRTDGFLGLYRGGSSWIAFAGPRSAVRFGTFEALSTRSRQHELPQRFGQAKVEAVCGLCAGVAETVACNTPNQVIAIKMIHDASPRGPRQYKGLLHAMVCMHRESGFLGFYQGMAPAVLKGAATNVIRFPVYGWLKRLIQGESQGGVPPPPLSPLQSLLAGGTCGAISAVITQPIDTIKANMMGLEARRFKSSIGCAVDLVRAGGVRVLFNGVGPRVVRVVSLHAAPPKRDMLSAGLLPLRL